MWLESTTIRLKCNPYKTTRVNETKTRLSKTEKRNVKTKISLHRSEQQNMQKQDKH